MRFLGASSALAMLTVFLCPAVFAATVAPVQGKAVFAATVAPVQGKVSINRGSGYEPISGPTQATPGDSVMVSPGGSARVVYDDQCSHPVKPGRVVPIAPEPPCNESNDRWAWASPPQRSWVGQERMASGDPHGTRVDAWHASTKAFHEPPPRHNWLPLVAAGVVGIAGLVWCVTDLCDRPDSP